MSKTHVPREGEPLLHTGRISSVDLGSGVITMRYGHSGTHGLRTSSIEIPMRTHAEQLLHFRRYYRVRDADTVPMGPNFHPIFSGDAIYYWVAGAQMHHGRQADLNRFIRIEVPLHTRNDLIPDTAYAQLTSGVVSGVFENIYTPRAATQIFEAQCQRHLPLYAIPIQGSDEFDFTMHVGLQNDRLATYSPPLTTADPEGNANLERIHSFFAPDKEQPPQLISSLIASFWAPEEISEQPPERITEPRPAPQSNSDGNTNPSTSAGTGTSTTLANRHNSRTSPTVLTTAILSNWIMENQPVDFRTNQINWTFNSSLPAQVARSTLIQHLEGLPATPQTLSFCHERCLNQQNCSVYQIYLTPSQPQRLSCSFHRLTQPDFSERVPYERPDSVPADAAQIMFYFPARFLPVQHEVENLLLESTATAWLGLHARIDPRWNGINWIFNRSFPAENHSHFVSREFVRLEPSAANLEFCRNLCLENRQNCSAFEVYPNQIDHLYWNCALLNVDAQQFSTLEVFAHPGSTLGSAQILFHIPERVNQSEGITEISQVSAQRLSPTEGPGAATAAMRQAVMLEANVSTWIGQQNRANRGLRWMFNTSFPADIASTTRIQELRNVPGVASALTMCRDLCFQNTNCAAFQFFPRPGHPVSWACSLHQLNQEQWAARTVYERPATVPTRAVQVLFYVPGRVRQ